MSVKNVALKNQRTLKTAKEGEIHGLNSNLEWHKLDILDQLVNDKPVSIHIQEKVIAQNELNKLKLNVIKVLNTNGYKVLEEDTESVIALLKTAQLINPHSEYVTVDLVGGYIAPGNKYVVELLVSKAELYKGYVYIKDNKTYIDDVKKAEYYTTLGGL
jgi:hypothetical protein